MGFVVTVSQEEQEQGHRGPTVPEEHGARLAPEQKGGSGDSIPLELKATSSAQKEDTRSLSMVQESN